MWDPLAVAIKDPAGNRKSDKYRRTGRIDGIQARQRDNQAQDYTVSARRIKKARQNDSERAFLLLPFAGVCQRISGNY